MLSRPFTDRMKVLAIIGIFAVHSQIVNLFPILNFAGYSNAIFLILSGYGLYCSTKLEPLSPASFFSKRLRRVVAPAAIVLSLYILIWAFNPDLSTALLGGMPIVYLGLWSFLYHVIFFTHFWFISCILFWYASYALLSCLPAAKPVKMSVLLLIAVLLSIRSQPEFAQWSSYSLSFPVGVLIGLAQEPLAAFLRDRRRLAMLTCLLLAAFSVFFNNQDSILLQLSSTQSIYLYSLASLSFGISIIGIFYLLQLHRFFNFLSFLDGATYEFYLVHLSAIISAGIILHWFLNRDSMFALFFVLYLVLAFILSCLLAIGLKRLLSLVFGAKPLSQPPPNPPPEKTGSH